MKIVLVFLKIIKKYLIEVLVLAGEMRPRPWPRQIINLEVTA